MLVESNDLLTPANAAQLAGLTIHQLQEQVRNGQIKPFVTIDGQRFYHKAEALALRGFLASLAGKRPSTPVPRMQELF